MQPSCHKATCCPARDLDAHKELSSPLWAEEQAWTQHKLLMKHHLCWEVCARDIKSSPGAVQDLGEAQWLFVRTATAPCTRVLDHPNMSPPIVQRSGHPTMTFFHYEIVWEKHSPLSTVRVE